MLAIQRPLTEITDRYAITLSESDKQGGHLYSATRTSEQLYALLRFAVYFMAFGLLVIPVAGILALISLGVSLIAMIGGGDLAEIGSSMLTLFGVLLLIGWIGISYMWAYSNISASQRERTGHGKKGREVAWAIGARDYSSRERDRIEAALLQIHSHATSDLFVHDTWWIIDSEVCQAVTLGDDLYVTTGALKSNWLVPILAHELGHLANKDGWMLSALRSFVAPFILYRLTNFAGLGKGILFGQQTVSDVKEIIGNRESAVAFFLSGIWFGGLGVSRKSSEWAQWFRDRDYLADDFVIQLQLKDQLLTYLENNPLMTLAVPFSGNWSQFNELRIDRIRLSGNLSAPTT